MTDYSRNPLLRKPGKAPGEAPARGSIAAGMKTGWKAIYPFNK